MKIKEKDDNLKNEYDKYIDNLSQNNIGYIINNLLFEKNYIGNYCCYLQIENCKKIVLISDKEKIKEAIIYDKNDNRIFN